MTNFLLCLPIFLPLLFFLTIMTKKSKFFNFKKLYYIFLLASILAVAANIFIFKDLSLKLNFGNFSVISLSFDQLSVMFVILSSVLWIFVSVYSFGYFKNTPNKEIFFSFFLLTFAVVVGISIANNLITFYIFYEILSFCSFFMIIFTGTKEAFASAKKYLTYSLYSSLIIIVGMILLYKNIGALDFTLNANANISNTLSKANILIPYFTLFIGFGIKAALVPLHGWLPSSMAAPTPVCALIMEVITVKTSILALVRITYYIFGWDTINRTIGNNTMLLFVLLNILTGSFLALHQTNLKKRLAYSTISQLGYIMFTLVIFDKEIFMGSMLHLVFHSINKIILFLCIGNVIYATGKTELNQIFGIGKKMPKTMICFTIAAFSLIGIPPANIFMSKWFLAIGGIGLGKYYVPLFLMLSALLTAEYLVPIITAAFFKGEKTVEVNYREPNNEMVYSIVGLTVLSIFTGIFPTPIISLIQSISETLF